MTETASFEEFQSQEKLNLLSHITKREENDTNENLKSHITSNTKLGWKLPINNRKSYKSYRTWEIYFHEKLKEIFYNFQPRAALATLPRNGECFSIRKRLIVPLHFGLFISKIILSFVLSPYIQWSFHFNYLYYNIQGSILFIFWE